MKFAIILLGVYLVWSGEGVVAEFVFLVWQARSIGFGGY